MEIKAADASSKVSKATVDLKSGGGGEKKTRESKKRNKRKHRRGKKKVKLEKKLAAISVVKQKKVLNYLDAWSTREESDWKFSKSINNWLVKNWSNEGFLDDDKFKIFIEYVGSFGSDCAARRQLVTRAENLLKESTPQDTTYKRCRSLIQTLI